MTDEEMEKIDEGSRAHEILYKEYDLKMDPWGVEPDSPIRVLAGVEAAKTALKYMDKYANQCAIGKEFDEISDAHQKLKIFIGEISNETNTKQ